MISFDLINILLISLVSGVIGYLIAILEQTKKR